MPIDVLSKLNRLLAITPEDAFCVPPVARQTIVAAVAEIALLRKRVAEFEQRDTLATDLIAIVAALHVEQPEEADNATLSS